MIVLQLSSLARRRTKEMTWGTGHISSIRIWMIYDMDLRIHGGFFIYGRGSQWTSATQNRSPH